MKKKILAMFIIGIATFGSLTSVYALSCYGSITKNYATATIDWRPIPSTLGFKGYYEVVDINNKSKIITINTSVSNRVMFTKQWNAPEHFESERLNVDALVNGRFEALIDKRY